MRVFSEDLSVMTVTYALLDKGSDSTLCKRDLAESLGQKGMESSFTLNSVEKKGSSKTGQIVALEVKSIDGEVVELPKIQTMNEIPVSSECTAKHEDIKKWSHLKDIESPEVNAKVSLLIRNDVPEVFWVEE